MIRDATSADVLALLALDIRCFGAGAWGAPSFERAIVDAAQDVRVMASGTGYGMVRVVEDTADLDRVAVQPAIRRQGVGRYLLEDLMDHARQRGARRMMLEVSVENTGALALYVSAGFAEIHRRSRYYSGGIDALIMERSLAD